MAKYSGPTLVDTCGQMHNVRSVHLSGEDMEPPSQNLPVLLPPPVPAVERTLDEREPRLPRDEALSLTRRLKRSAIWCSAAAFLALLGLAASHVTGVTAAQTNSANDSGSNSQSSSNSQNGGFFGNGGDNGGFGPGSTGLPQSPVSGTSVS
jgi:hypothetical protein